ncbi:MAG: asparagine synthase (glutamine-hydrolyzing) [Desulfovibrio sp.]|nr:MAG: asparagine synthase (glutamine-hydrolyzing) [Desulfovibrio sp.]
MCGIAGFWHPSRPGFEPEGMLRAMGQAMRHRGPDSQGEWYDSDAGLGLSHVRLAILDLSPTGHQPMFSPDERYILAYNGEIYNFHTIRKELEEAGYAPEQGWRGTSDTEVLLAACMAWGVEGALTRSVGMFALALWDRRERVLSLARDRMGIKPLYYGLAGENLVFGSELKPILRHPAMERRVDRNALTQYLRYLYVPAPSCIFQGLRQLPPGTILRIRASDLDANIIPEPQAYWSVAQAVRQGLANPTRHEDVRQASEELESILQDAVNLRMIADVPLGAFLSGGIDSSTVAALMQAGSSRPVKTFSIGSHVAEYNEAEHARDVAERLGTDHTELYVSEDEARQVIPLLGSMYDEPFADASQIPTYLVSRLARQEVIVSLSGDGGDELFGGYNRYLMAPKLWRKLSRLGPSGRRAMAAMLRHGGETAVSGLYGLLKSTTPAKDRHLTFRDKLQKVTEAMAARDRMGFFHNLASYWLRPETLVDTAREPDTVFSAPSDEWRELAETLDYPRLMMAVDQVTYLPGDILAKVDRASMAVSLEARVPILDHRVVEFAWTLPLSMLIQGSQGKHILRQVLYRHVEPELVERPKQGFSIPLDTWLRGPLKEWAADLLDPQTLQRQGFFRPEPVTQAWHEHQSGRRNRQYQLWAVLMFQAWAREFSQV